mgnify:FL=1
MIRRSAAVRARWKKGAVIAIRKIVVRSLNPQNQRGWLTCGNLVFRCALGRGGILALKREGDGATPRGQFRLETARYRTDRLGRPRTVLPLSATRTDDGWCDAANDRNYNRAVTHPYPASAEKLWRTDGLYDVFVVLDYNRRPRQRGRGSAIFLHVAGEGLAPTEGCVALARRDLLKLLPLVDRHTRLVVL